MEILINYVWDIFGLYFSEIWFRCILVEILIMFGTYLVYISRNSGLDVFFVEILIMFGTYLDCISLLVLFGVTCYI